MTVPEAFIRGWGIALRHPILIILKWALNLSFALFLVGPVRGLLEKDLRGLPGEGSGLGFDTPYLLEFLDHYSRELVFITDYWWPLILAFFLANLFLQGGILSAIQRRERMPWSQVLTACGKSFVPLLVVLALSLALSLVTLFLPLSILEFMIAYLETRNPDSGTLFLAYWILLGVIVLIILGYALSMGKLTVWFKSRIFVAISVLLLGLAAIVLPLLVLPDVFVSVANRYPDARIMFWLYWGGTGIILLIMGTWAWRVYLLARLFTCREREDNRGPSIIDATAQFFSAMAVTTRLYWPTLFLWLLFLTAAVAIFPFMSWMGSLVLPENASPIQRLGFGQITIIARIIADMALLAGFHVLTRRSPDISPAPTVGISIEDSEEINWRAYPEEHDASEVLPSKVIDEPENITASSPIYPNPAEEESK